MFATGIIKPGVLDFKLFAPNIYSLGNKVIGTDIIRFIIIIIFLFLICFDIFKNFRSNNLRKIIFNFNNFLMVFILIVYALSFFIKFIYCNNEDKLYSVNSSTYLDTYSIAVWFNRVFYVESLLFAFVSIKLLHFLKFIDFVNLFYTNIINGTRIIAKYSLFITAILIVYSCIANIIWGPFDESFATMGRSIVNVLLITIGFFNINLMMTYDVGWTIVFLLTLFIFILFFMFSIFIAIFVESERNTINNIGYPEDNQYTSWKLRDYIVWLCFFVGRDNKEEKK